MTDVTEADDAPVQDTRYVFYVEDIMAIGSLSVYATAWESCHYGDASISSHVVSWELGGEPIRHLVAVEMVERDENDYLDYRLTVNGESATVRIDGRN